MIPRSFAVGDACGLSVSGSEEEARLRELLADSF
jgi:hypothetical protein